MSAALPVLEASCETCVVIVLLMGFIANNIMAANLYVLTSSYDGSSLGRFDACEC